MFKVGQLVWCKVKDCYAVTDYHVKCKILRTSDKSKVISVQVLEGCYEGDVHPVDGCDFEPVYKKAVIV